ncbi:DUF4405 domain-containing protein [Aureimonas altamirensis]|uniref:DUF4405 domain-containing protein n=1 Tax=Aureimonas altamirensis TaxID=370622 RepID=UPI001E3F1ABB|nr:DUF4405 domain-containing protein [Aureimonas altamirensis]UHD46407.1 DUF4405 domain-containing protein [Aureimonas altamirensis]
MSTVLRLRLVFDFLAFGLLLFGFSYWWLGNLTHEIAGTIFFLLLIAHNVFNRGWYGRRAQARDPRGITDTLGTFALLVATLVLLVTSVLISNALSGYFSLYGGFTVRQIHTLAAYWVLLLLAVHLGLRWPMLMSFARNATGVRMDTAFRRASLRLAALLVAIQGVRSSSELALGQKLTMQMSLDWWNFEESVVGFFAHCAAIVGLYAVVTYYGLALVRLATSRRRRRG